MGKRILEHITTLLEKVRLIFEMEGLNNEDKCSCSPTISQENPMTSTLIESCLTKTNGPYNNSSIDYWMQLRKNLARCHQNDKSLSEYTHELHELLNMIGDIPERDRVLKFWNSVWSTIQKGLWRDNLNPETLPWDLVVAQAKVIEISENVAERQDWQNGLNSKVGSFSNNPKMGHSGSRSSSMAGAVHSCILWYSKKHSPTNEQPSSRANCSSTL